MMLHKKSNPTRLFKLLALVPIVAVTLAVNAETVEDVVLTQPQKQIVKKGKVNKTFKMGNQSLVVVEDKTQKEEAEAPKSVETPSTDGDILIDVVEDMPQFPGGTQKLFEYLAKNVRYPKEAEEKCIQGRVIVTFVVEKDGSITDAKVLRSVAPSLDAEALRVVNDMPKWIPGKQDGEPVRVKYTIPITFCTIPADNEKQVDQLSETVVVGIGDNAKAIHTNTPYVVVDGKPIDGDKLKDIDPKTIDHMEVLKSKVAIEKYGDKAKNGVIVITTKK